jgi:hypothetical protein
MKRFLCALLVMGLGTLSGSVAAEDAIYEGLWRTTNRKLDGTMTCIVRDLGRDQSGQTKWSGRFYGIWQGVPFDYTVAFAGPPEKLTGKAQIDGADYTWTGDMNADADGRFKGTFGGNRYTGYFDLKRKQPAATAAVPRPAVPR